MTDRTGGVRREDEPSVMSRLRSGEVVLCNEGVLLLLAPRCGSDTVIDSLSFPFRLAFPETIEVSSWDIISARKGFTGTLLDL